MPETPYQRHLNICDQCRRAMEYKPGEEMCEIGLLLFRQRNEAKNPSPNVEQDCKELGWTVTLKGSRAACIAAVAGFGDIDLYVGPILQPENIEREAVETPVSGVEAIWVHWPRASTPLVEVVRLADYERVVAERDMWIRAAARVEAEKEKYRTALVECVRQMKSAASLLEMFPDDYGDAINKADQLLMLGDTYELRVPPLVAPEPPLVKTFEEETQ